MTRRVLVAGAIDSAGVELLTSNPETEIRHYLGSDEAELVRLARDVDAIAVRTARITAKVIDAAPKCRIIARHGVGYDNVAVDAATARGIPVAITGTANSSSVAEHTLMLMLALSKGLTRYDRATREGDFQFRLAHQARDLGGRALLILGVGRIGARVARLARAFDMTVRGFDPYLEAQTIAAHGAEAVDDWRAVLPQTDFLSIHTPLTAQTQGMVGAAELDLLAPHACVINCARGGIIDEPALAQRLASGRLHGAGIDVFDAEPPPPDHPLLKLDNVILSPHSAGLSYESSVRTGIITAQNVLAGLEGTLDPEMVVNPEVLEVNA